MFATFHPCYSYIISESSNEFSVQFHKRKPKHQTYFCTVLVQCKDRYKMDFQKDRIMCQANHRLLHRQHAQHNILSNEALLECTGSMSSHGQACRSISRSGICSCRLLVTLVQIFFLWGVKQDDVLLCHVLASLMATPQQVDCICFPVVVVQ